MAVHSFTDDEKIEFQSANRMRADLERMDHARRMGEYRLALDRQERARRSEGALDDVAKSVSNTAKEYKKQMEREFRQLMNESDITKEAYKETSQLKSVATIALGVTLAVTATAADAVYTRKMMEAQDDAKRSFLNDLKERTTQDAAVRQETLREYTARIEGTKQDLAIRQQSYMIEYNDTHAEAQKAIDDAHRTYNAKKTELDTKIDQCDANYKRIKDDVERQAAQSDIGQQYVAKLKAAEADHDSRAAVIKSDYESSKARIDKMYEDGKIGAGEHETMMSNAMSKFQRDVQSEVNRSETTLKTLRSEYDTQVRERFKPQFDELDKTLTERNTLISQAIASGNTARIERDAVIAQQTSVIQAAQTKRDEAIKHAQERQGNEQARFAKMQEAQIARGEAAAATRAKQEAGGLFHKPINVVKKYGTDDEVQLVSRVLADDKAAAKAKKDGTAYTHTVSKADRQMAEAIQNRCNTMAIAPLVQKTGTANEIALIDKVAKDQAAEIKALRAGKSYVPATTAEERQSAALITSQYAAAAVTASKAASTYGMKNVSIGGGNAAVDMVSGIKSENKRIAKELAFRFAKPEDKQLLDKVTRDREREKLAEKKGDKSFVPATSKEERAKADQIVASFAGDLRSVAGIQSTIKMLNKSVEDLTAEKFKLQDAIAAKKSEISLLEGQITDLQNKMSKLAADKEMLRTGKDSNGKKLTPDQIKAIQARVKNAGDLGTIQKDLSALLTKKNAAQNALTDLNEKLRSNNSLISGIQNHTKFLDKHKDVIPDVVKAGGLTKGFKNIFDHGKSKSAKAMQAAGVGMIMGSVSKLHRQFVGDIHNGDEIFKEVHGNARKLSQFARGYKRGISLMTTAGLLLVVKPTNMVTKVGKLAIGKFIGKETRLGKALTAMGNSKLAKGTKFIAGGTGKIIGGVLMAPVAILNAPMAIMNAPQTLAKAALKGTFNFTRRTGGVVVGGAAYLTRKTTKAVVKGTAKGVGKAVSYGINHTIGKTKWYQKAAEKANRWKEKQKSKRENRQKKRAARKEKRRNKKGPIKWLIGIIGTVIGYIISGLLWLLGFALSVIITLGAVAAIIALIYSVLDAIAAWWDNAQAKTQVLVQKDPQFIANMAVNYRNAELDILELFNKAHDGKVEVEVNDDPIYQALYNDSTGTRILKWFGIDTTTPISATNKQVYATINTIKNKYSTVYNKYTLDGVEYKFDKHYKEEQFLFEVLKYGTTALSYTNSKGVSSEYEISNAKDALAIVDSLYMMKPDTMQKNEVLAYLGIGDYQITDKDDNASDNLFWQTHKLTYKSGTSSADVWYHVTSSTSSNTTYGLSTTQKWVMGNNGTYKVESLTNQNVKTCDNYIKLVFTNEKQAGYTVCTHTALSNYTSSGYGEYKSNGAMKATTNYSNYTAPQAYYQDSMCNHLSSKDPLSFFTTSGSIQYYKLSNGKRVYYKEASTLGTTDFKNSYYKNATNCTKMNFFRKSGNVYYVVTGTGYYMGTVDLDVWTSIKNAVTKNGTRNYSWSGNKKIVSLPMFYLVYNNSSGVKNYQFHHVSSTTGANYTSNLGKAYYSSINFSTTNWTINCSHKTNVPAVTENITVNVCKGHIDLLANMQVTCIADDKKGTAFFAAAQKVPGIATDTKDWAIFTYNRDLDVCGFGGITWFAFDPSKDWSDTGMQQLAQTKTETNEVSYVIPKDKTVSELAIDIMHYKSTPYRDKRSEWTHFNSLAGPDAKGNMLLGMCIDDRVFYVESFVSGPQKEIVCYEISGGSLKSLGLLSIKVTSKGDVSLNFDALPAK